MEWFVFDGVASSQFGAYLAKSNMFDAPKRDITSISIPGRNGVLHIDNERFEPFTGKCTVYLPDITMSLDGLRNYLMSRGTCRYMESYKPGEYRIATFKEAFEVNSSDRRGASFELKFECSPERWLTSGEIPVVVTTATNIINAQMFNAKPLVEVIGTGSVTINGSTLNLVNNTGTTFIDCDLMDAYEGTINRNGDLTVTNEWPVLEPGTNAVTFSGFTSVKIYPRWWTI